jgi:hypothetical protein
MQQPLDPLSKALGLLESFRDSLMASLISEALPEKPPRGVEVLTKVSAMIGQADIPASQLLRQLAYCLEPAELPWTAEQFAAWEDALACAVARLDSQVSGRRHSVDPLAAARQSLRRLGVNPDWGSDGRKSAAELPDWRSAEKLEHSLAELETMIGGLEHRMGSDPG